MMKTLVWLPLILLSLTACDEAASPGVLTYNGEKIRPICFEAIAGVTEAPSDSVDLKKCMREGEPAKLDDTGFYTQQLSYDGGYGGYGGYIGYKPIGKTKQGEVLHLISSGGGSGQFSSLTVFVREGDVLRVVSGYGGGDRCQGVLEASVDGEAVLYTQGITAAGIAALGEEGDQAITDTNNLDDCASCCIASLSYRGEAPEELVMDDDWESNAVDGRMGCFKNAFTGKFGASKSVSYAKAKEFAGELRVSCPPNGTY